MTDDFPYVVEKIIRPIFLPDRDFYPVHFLVVPNKITEQLFHLRVQLSEDLIDGYRNRGQAAL